MVRFVSFSSGAFHFCVCVKLCMRTGLVNVCMRIVSVNAPACEPMHRSVSTRAREQLNKKLRMQQKWEIDP